MVNVNLSLINASQTNALNSMFIVILSIPISIMWTLLAKKKLNPRTPYKFGMGQFDSLNELLDHFDCMPVLGCGAGKVGQVQNS